MREGYRGAQEPHCILARVFCAARLLTLGVLFIYFGGCLLQLPHPAQRPPQAQRLQPAPFQVREGTDHRGKVCGSQRQLPPVAKTQYGKDRRPPWLPPGGEVYVALERLAPGPCKDLWCPTVASYGAAATLSTALMVCVSRDPDSHLILQAAGGLKEAMAGERPLGVDSGA